MFPSLAIQQPRHGSDLDDTAFETTSIEVDSQATILPKDPANNEPITFSFPTQFYAKILMNSTECHALRFKYNTSGTYPPCERLMNVHYDYINQRSAVRFERDLEDTELTFIKRYDLQQEYELKRICFDDEESTISATNTKKKKKKQQTEQNKKQICHILCRKSEMVPLTTTGGSGSSDSSSAKPRMPQPAQFVTVARMLEAMNQQSNTTVNKLYAIHTASGSVIREKLCNQWKIKDPSDNNQEYWYYDEVHSRSPVRLVTPQMVWDVIEFTAQEPSEDKFVVDEEFMQVCEPQANNIGFPSVHLLHAWIRV